MFELCLINLIFFTHHYCQQKGALSAGSARMNSFSVSAGRRSAGEHCPRARTVRTPPTLENRSRAIRTDTTAPPGSDTQLWLRIGVFLMSKQCDTYRALRCRPPQTVCPPPAIPAFGADPTVQNHEQSRWTSTAAHIARTSKSVNKH